MPLSYLGGMLYVWSRFGQQKVYKNAQLLFLGNNKISWRDSWAKEPEDEWPAVEADLLRSSRCCVQCLR